MSEIIVTGHRNPDFDSICSAAAYAAMKNISDPENSYIPVRCGHLSANTKKVLDKLGVESPPYQKDVYPKVSDVMLTGGELLDADAPLSELAKTYKPTNPSVAPVFRDGKFAGLISIDDITAWTMSQLAQCSESGAAFPCAIPKIGEIMGRQEAPLQIGDMFDDAKAALTASMLRGLAVFDGEEFRGYVIRRCFLKKPRNQVIMVDHNEAGQSIRGIETADVVGIIDHHRLDSVKTDLPIMIDTEPLGSTCTIVYRHYRRKGLLPDPQTAKTLLTGITSDTLILRSPTTTQVDIDSVKELAELCGVDHERFGREMFSEMESLGSQDPEEAIRSDFKEYCEHGVRFGIGQCEVTTLSDVGEYYTVYRDTLETVKTGKSLDWALLMITDVLREKSLLLCTGYKAERSLPYSALPDAPGKIYDMPGVMSRKKQLLPEIIHSLALISNL